MNRPSVSVIMSAYNSDKYIAESIKSILNQTLKSLELIIIDDASKDNTLNIIKKFSKIDTRIRLILNRKNVGPAESRNKG